MCSFLLLELLLNGIFVGAKLGLAGLGFAVIFYTTRDLHFAFGALLTTTGYLGYVFIAQWGMPAVVGVVFTLALGALLGMAVQYWLYRPLTDHLSILLMSLGFSIVVENTLQIVFGVHDKLLPSGPLGRLVVMGDIWVRVLDFVVVAAFLLLWLLVYFLMHRHRVGRALRAVMKDPYMSELVGIRTRRIKLFAYGLGTGIGAVAGLLTVAETGLRPSAGFEVLTFAFIATLLGLGSLHRVALWGLGLGVMMNLFSWQFPTQFQTLFVFAFMLVYMLVRDRRPPVGQH